MSEWEIKSAQDVAEALDWVRRRMRGNGLVLVAIGPNSIAYAKDQKLSASAAELLVKANLETIYNGLVKAEAAGHTRGASKRGDIE